MKTLITAILFSLTASTSAYHCEVHEAQVEFTVKSVSKVESTCEYKLDVESVNVNVLCPLYGGDIERSALVTNVNSKGLCPFEEGDFFHRILVKLEDGTIILD